MTDEGSGCPDPMVLDAWRLGELVPEEASPVASHVEGCENCGAFMAADADLAARPAEALAREARARPVPRGSIESLARLRRWWPVLAGLALAVLALLLYTFGPR